MTDAPMTVVETAEFLTRTKQLMSESARAEFVAFIGASPEAGDVVPGTGGVRKVRWGLVGRGKRGGARIVYYFHNHLLPLFLLSAYPKNQKANLSEAERNAMKRLVSALVRGYLRKVE